MRTDWMRIAKEYNETEEQREKILGYIAKVEWQELKNGVEVAAMPGLGIKEAIKQLRIPKVSHIAISHDMAPYGFYGIRGHYKSEDVDVFVVDEGHAMVPVCANVTTKEGVTAS